MRNITRLTQARFAKEGQAWSPVALPHTWNALDGQDGGNDYWRGVGTYQIDLPDPIEGLRQYVEIQGANHVATVYCNGRLMGVHKGGFSTFRFDLTDAMRPTGNLLTMAVTNAACDVYPQQADFTFFGGLYREVRLIQVRPSHFDLLKDGTDAVFVTPHAGGSTRFDLFPVAWQGCTVEVTILDAEGNPVETLSAPAQAHTVLKTTLAQPHLWDGLADPYCYTAQARLLKHGQVQDSVTVTYGYRSFRVDAETGFWLNGKRLPLRGVARHQDRLDKGWALSRADHEEDAALIREVGANTIRLAHYQHDPYFYDLCDRTGFVLWAEIPFISRFLPSQEARDNTLSQMTELIAQNYNRPSICFWGISNEITIGEESEGLYRNLCELNALCKRLDPSRLTTMAVVSMMPMTSDYLEITDLISYNLYFGWYNGDPEDNGPWFDQFHALHPDRPLGLSEYGAEAVLQWHCAAPENHDYTEEYACLYHHELLKAFETRPFLWATHCWNMFDFAADFRDEGGVAGRNNKGLVTYDRKTKKEPFYLYKAYWNPEPMVHVCGERFADRAPAERDVTVYSNCPEVTLLLNGREIAALPVQDHAAVFANVPLRAGENLVTARCGNIQGNVVRLNGVAEHNFAYDLPEEEGLAANWFDDPIARAARKPLEYPEGCYSIKDKIGDLLQNPQAAEVVNGFLRGMQSAAASSGANIAEGAGDSMMDFYRKARLNHLLKMAGKILPPGTKRTLNEQLTKIKKG